MRIKNTGAILAFLSASAVSSGTFAAAVPGDVVYQKTDSFSQSVTLTDSFTVNMSGLYRATLKDLENAKPFLSSSLVVSKNSSSLGGTNGPGSFTFEAEAGDHSVNLFADVGAPDISDEEKKELIEESHKTHGSAWWSSLTADEKAERKARWKSWTDAEKKAHQQMVYERNERRVEEQLASMYTGEYDIEIVMIQTPTDPGTVVPVPAAVWLFGSGLLALVGAARRKTAS